MTDVFKGELATAMEQWSSWLACIEEGVEMVADGLAVARKASSAQCQLMVKPFYGRFVLSKPKG